jgi:OmpA-OmpF porin, OOP family
MVGKRAPFLSAALLVGAASAHAADLPLVSLEPWAPPAAVNAGLLLEPASTAGSGVLAVGLRSSYARRPVVTVGSAGAGGGGTIVSNRVTTVLDVSVGIGTRLELGAALPFVLWQSGDDPRLRASALRDMEILGKVNLVDNREGLWGLSLLGRATLPTGRDGSLAADGQLTASSRILVEYNLLIAAAQVSLGYGVRPASRDLSGLGLPGLSVGDMVPFSAGVSLKPGAFLDAIGRGHRVDLGVYGELPAGPTAPFSSGASAVSPVLLHLSDHVVFGDDGPFSVDVGVDLGLSRAVGVPDVRLAAGFSYTKRNKDQDGDGVPDALDACIDVPEDRDGFEDADGCPDIDDDNDGIPDAEDACPRTPGRENADPKRAGCP